MPLSTPSPISYPHKFTTPPSQNTTPMPTPTPPPTPARISLRFLPTVIWKKDKTKKGSGSWCSAQGAPCAGTPTGRGFCLSSPRPSHLLTPGCKNREGEEPAQDPGGQRLRIWRSPGQHHSTWPLKKKKKTLSSNKGKNPEVPSQSQAHDSSILNNH